MSDRSTKHPPGVEDLLAPPPFGVAETTGDQLLPIATSMEHVLDEARLPEPEPEPEPAPEPVLLAEPEPVPAPPVAVAPPASAHVEEAPQNSNRTIAAAVVVVLLLGAGGFFWMNRGGDAAGDQPGLADAGAVSPGSGVTPDATPQTPSLGGEPAPSVAALPTDLETLRKLSFEERHAGLAQVSGDVPVELHIGLDLVQAAQSEDPCRTFSDALSSIESSEDPTTFKWALDEASVPSGQESASCKGLTQRLAAAKGSGAEEKAPAARPVPRSSKGERRAKPRPSRPRPSAAPPADPAKQTEPTTPTPPPTRKPSVATKLDDDLRGLGE